MSNGTIDIYYYHTDQIGTPLELTNQQGTIVWQANYKAWGEIESCRINDVEQNLRYQGQYFDQETELHYNTFRYYDPQIGRYTTQDPIGLEGSFNLYSYVLNPIIWIDPWGWCGWSTARKNFWKAEAKNPSRTYSANNIARMQQGKAPQMSVQVINRKTGAISTRTVSMELHHTNIPQRIGGAGVHSSSNLSILTPWQHEAVDTYRHVGSDLLNVIKDIDVF